MISDTPATIHGLHHMAWRCSDSERTRAFYEDLLGLPLVDAIRIAQSKTGRATQVLHTFFSLGDGACLAFFEAPDQPFDIKRQQDFDLHVALRVDAEALEPMKARALAHGVEVRGISDHGFIRSIYLRDPDGYVVELTAPVSNVASAPIRLKRQLLADWQKAKSSAPGSTWKEGTRNPLG
jgi:catechol 2,3-dioxygenase-like lactoylglutathione lyase family enzyme